MKLVYIAGAYRAATPQGVMENIEAARVVARQVAERGEMPVTPHLLSHGVDARRDDLFWLEGTLELMRRCDEVQLVPGWTFSKGTLAEVTKALDLGLPVRLPGGQRLWRW
jgi:hypothetical protein